MQEKRFDKNLPPRENKNIMEKEEKTENIKIVKTAKKRNPLLLLFGTFFAVILTLLILLAGLLVFCALDKKSPLAVLPPEFSAYIHTDSLYDAVNPLLDLEAAEVLLSSPQFTQYRKPFMDFRSSPLRTNRFLKILSSRKIDAALYGAMNNQKNFVASLDLSYLSFASRWAYLIFPRLNIKVPGLSYFPEEKVFQYQQGKTLIYAKAVKNLLIVSDRYELFAQAYQGQNESSYSDLQKDQLTKKTNQRIRLVVNAAPMAMLAAGNDPMLSGLARLISPETFSVVSFDITDSQIDVELSLPVHPDADRPTSLDGLVTKDSELPVLLTRLSGLTQYYTILNAGSLEELKNALFPLLPPEKNADGLWKTAEGACKSLFSLSLEDMLFSWSGKEFAVLGIEGKNDPVFAIQVKDEKKRAEIFDKIVSSFLIKDDTSLVLGGVRLPKLQLPGYLDSLLRLFGLTIPAPYYLLQDGFIYFSESSECLSAVYTSINDGKKLSANQNWKDVSAGRDSKSAVSLYYDLEHSSPFFLRSNDIFVKILKLYTIGRADFSVKSQNLTVSLKAVARRSGDLRSIAGYPIDLAGLPAQEIIAGSGKNPDRIFWLEDGHLVKSLELASLKVSEFDMNDSGWILGTGQKLSGGGVLWALTKNGALYLLDGQLKTVENFPVMFESNPSACGTAYGKEIVIPLEDSSLTFVDASGRGKMIPLELSGSVKSSPAVSGKTIAIYDKGFAGKIIQIEDAVIQSYQMDIPGIAFGSPAIVKDGSKTYTGIITQAGEVSVWSDGQMLEEFPFKVDGLFYTNLVAGEKCFYALSDSAVIYKIFLDGRVDVVKIPDASAKNATMAVLEPRKNGKKGLYICADGNVIYGFKENLELMTGFPLTGWGIPAFADANGDGELDLLAVTLNKKLVAWNLR